LDFDPYTRIAATSGRASRCAGTCTTIAAAALVGALLFPALVQAQAVTASLLDLSTNSVISNFVVGNGPQGAAWSGTVAFVTNENDNSLVRLDMTTSPPTVNQTFTGFPESFLPNAVAVNPAGTRVIVSGDGTNLYILDVSVTPFTIADTVTVIADAGGVAYYSNGTRAIVANEGNVLILDVTTVPAGVTTVALGNQAHGVAVNAAGTRAVVSIDTGGVQVLDLTTIPPSLIGSVVGPLTGDPLGVAISPDGTRAIYAQESTPAPAAIVVDLSGVTLSVVATVPLSILSPSAVAFNPATGAALIAGDDGVAVLNPPYTAVNATIAHPGRRGATSYSLAVNPAGTRALVLHEDTFFCTYPIDFGDVVVNTTKTIVETCQNTGSGPFTVNTVSVSAGFGLNGVPALPLVLAAGASFTFNVTFTPPSAGPQTGSLNVVGDTFDSSVSLSGNGVIAFAPVLQSAASRKVHGGAGTFDLPLSLIATAPNTEPRQGPAQMIVFTFDKPLSGATATITEGTATAGTPTFSGNDVLVPLTGVTNQQYVTIALTNVAAVDGGTGGSGSVRVGFLAGDVNQNRVVTVADLGLVNQQLAQVVTAANFLRDVNASGTLTVADKGITNANLTKSLPAP
jgi:DNA-binding beta-propeller fold protein YncE